MSVSLRSNNDGYLGEDKHVGPSRQHLTRHLLVNLLNEWVEEDEEGEIIERLDVHSLFKRCTVCTVFNVFSILTQILSIIP